MYSIVHIHSTIIISLYISRFYRQNYQFARNNKVIYFNLYSIKIKLYSLLIVFNLNPKNRISSQPNRPNKKSIQLIECLILSCKAHRYAHNSFNLNLYKGELRVCPLIYKYNSIENRYSCAGVGLETDE